MRHIGSSQRIKLAAIITMAVFAYITLLAFYHDADYDLWHRLMMGSSIWHRGGLITADIFAFTETLPKWVDHEWGSGLLLFTLLRIFGPLSLMLYKIAAALGVVLVCATGVRRSGCGWITTILLATLAALNILPAYVPVVRSHVITYFFFALTLLHLERIRSKESGTALPVVVIMLLWTNLHGGFVAGLGLIAVYTIDALARREACRPMLTAALGSLCVTLINPYGRALWDYLIPAILLQRAHIPEWGPLPLLGRDIFYGFRIFFFVSLLSLAFGWRGAGRVRSWPAMVILAFSACLGFRHMRHTTFFGIAAAFVIGPYLESCLRGLRANVPFPRIRPMSLMLILYAAIAVYSALWILPYASLHAATPMRRYPVREVDILMYSGAAGNLVVPFGWGGYATWRLYPRIKISMCGRYEAMYPESVVMSNYRFYRKIGSDWAGLLKRYDVDYIIVDMRRTRMRKKDWADLGFEVIWWVDNSVLLARQELVPLLREAARAHPPGATIEPLDASIPAKWW